MTHPARPQGYANSHALAMMSIKRFSPSPFADRYITPETTYGLYCRRLYALSIGDDPIAQYWNLRRAAVLYDVPERPLDIVGPDAEQLLERVFARRLSTLLVGRARYVVACNDDGNVLIDGVVLRRAHDRFMFVQADGEFEPWLRAQARALDVKISDPQARVLQIQGPAAYSIMRDATDGALTSNFKYFHAGEFALGSQRLFISRTGWTGELGYEIYTDGACTDHGALWDHLLRAGRPHGLTYTGLDSMGIRRLEAGILDYGTDFDDRMTPFDVGLDGLVDLDKPGGFIGDAALRVAPRGKLLFGLRCADIAPRAGDRLVVDGEPIGTVTAGVWSPALEAGIGYARLNRRANWLGMEVTLCPESGLSSDAQFVSMPFVDPEKRLPRTLG